MNKKTTLSSALLLLLLVGCSSGEKPRSGNPLFEGWYADPEVVIFGNQYWIFPTFSARYEDQIFMDAFSSSDLVTWHKHSRILDTSIVKWVDHALWAPSAIEKDGLFYLFFAGNDIQSPANSWWNPEIHTGEEVGGIGVAVAERPEGPYRDLLGKPLINEFYNDAQPIDQYVFKDKDGSYYIVYGGWGRCNIGKLNDSFTALVPFEDGDMVKEITPEGYVEGPVMFYRNDKLYFMWSEGNWGNNTYKVAYAIAGSPFGPFERIGTVLETDPEIATGAGHHSVMNIPGTDDWYIVYHRRPIPNEDRDHRVVSIDRMFFNSDGNIMPVVMTNEGVERRVLK
jgi:beta-xylosidase